MSTYAEREAERYGGQPVEGFRFVQGSNTWLFTSADREVTFPIGTFIPTTIARTATDHSNEDGAGKMEFMVPADNPVALLFIDDVPSTPVWVTAYRAHRGDETETVTMFTGKITRARFKGSEATLVGTSTGALMNRNCPNLIMQTPCNHVLFSAECGANPTSCRDSATIATVDGVEVTSSDFALQPDQWFRGGRLQKGGETRFIGDHQGDTIILISALPGLETLDVVYAYWGCDHLEPTCGTKFSNLDNHLGWSRLPGRNPFTTRIDS